MNTLKKILIFFVIAITQIAIAQTNKRSPGEITATEWDAIGNLIITYAVGKVDDSIRVNCTAFNEGNKPVGGGTSFTGGGVARVYINVPKNYVNSESRLTVKCNP